MSSQGEREMKRNLRRIVLSCAVLFTSTIQYAPAVLAQDVSIDFSDELKAIGAGKAGGQAKVKKITPASDATSSSAVDFSSELDAISAKQSGSSADDWNNDLNNFKQGVASVKEQNRLDKIETLRSKCTNFWNKPAASTCKLATHSYGGIVLSTEFSHGYIKKKCRRFKGNAFYSCKERIERAQKKREARGRRENRRKEEAFRSRAKDQQRHCQKERAFCENIKEDVQQGVIPRKKFPSWTPSDKRAMAKASQNLDDFIEPQLDQTISLQKQQDRKASDKRAAIIAAKLAKIRAAKAEQEAQLELKKLSQNTGSSSSISSIGNYGGYGHSPGPVKPAKDSPDPRDNWLTQHDYSLYSYDRAKATAETRLAKKNLCRMRGGAVDFKYTQKHDEVYWVTIKYRCKNG